MYNLISPHRGLGLRISRQLSARARLIFNVHYTTANTSPTKTKRQSPTTRKWLFSFSVILISCGGAYLAIQQQLTQTVKNQIDPAIFHPFELVSKHTVSSTCSIFALRSHNNNPYHNLYREAWKKGGVWSVQIKQPQLQIARSYTPLPPHEPRDDDDKDDDDDDDENGDGSTELRFLIRREPHGEMSGYLHDLPLGSVVHVRGLNLEYELAKDIDEVLFVAGGTGIVPALQVAHSLLQRRKSAAGFVPKMHILWANRRREDAYLGGADSAVSNANADLINNNNHNQRRHFWNWRNSLFWIPQQPEPPIQHHRHQQPSPQSAHHQHHQQPHHSPIIIPQLDPDIITLTNLIDEESTFITPNLLKTYLTTPTTDHLNQPTPPPPPSPPPHHHHQQAPPPPPRRRRKTKRRKVVMVSGPEGFVAHYAGPKVWIGGKETQGLRGGLLGEFLEADADSGAEWEVWKF